RTIAALLRLLEQRVRLGETTLHRQRRPQVLQHNAPEGVGVRQRQYPAEERERAIEFPAGGEDRRLCVECFGKDVGESGIFCDVCTLACVVDRSIPLTQGAENI